MIGKVIRRFGASLLFNWLRCQVFRLGGVKIGRGTQIERGATLGKNVKLGNRVRICKYAFVGGNVDIGDDAKIGRYAHVGPEVAISRKVIIGAYVYVANSKIGSYSFIESFVQFTGFKSGRITIGKNSYIGIYGILDWSGNIEIGDGVHIAGPSVGIWTHTSVFQCLSEDTLLDNKRKRTAPVNIENYSYIGGNSTIYPGVTIRHHSIILPNTAVDKDVDNWTMVGGVPAKVVRKIEKNKGELKFKTPKHLNT